MCFSTKKLKFLDIINFLAPGYSYEKYLKAYGCELQKYHFPYEYMDGIGKMEDSALPHQEAFYSRLKNEGISDEDYARCQAVWRDNGMKTMHDFLVWYNNRDVVSFLDAIDKQFAFYKQQNIDMFKDGVSGTDIALSLHRTSVEHLLRCLQPDEQRSAPTRQRQYRWWSGHHISPLP